MYLFFKIRILFIIGKKIEKELIINKIYFKAKLIIDQKYEINFLLAQQNLNSLEAVDKPLFLNKAIFPVELLDLLRLEPFLQKALFALDLSDHLIPNCNLFLGRVESNWPQRVF
jgi:hypothetical protein